MFENISCKRTKKFLESWIDKTRNGRSKVVTMFSCNNATEKVIEDGKKKEKMYFLHFTIEHTGKMEGIYSLSTSVLKNVLCQNRQRIANSICAKCFAQNMVTGRFRNMEPALERNTEILTSDVIPFEFLPIINALYFRFESFGDLNNEIQVVNYFNIARKNPRTTFVLWTKNPFLIRTAIKKGMVEKPDNVIVIYSSPIENTPVELETIKKVYPFIDKVFTVWESEDKISEAGLKCNCGDRICINCLRCYTKSEKPEMNNIVEIEK